MTTSLTPIQPDQRSRTEARIALQARVLRDIVSLIAAKVPWGSWPRLELSVLKGALTCDGRNTFEDAKARNLEWHLFRGKTPLLEAGRLPEMSDMEERVRADLAGLVRLGSGRGL